MPMAEIKLLFVDDDDVLRTTLGAVLTQRGFLLTSVSSVREALELISTQKFDVLLSDLNIGEPGDGFTVVSAMRRVQPDACTFILTGYPDLETAIQGIRRVSKPGQRRYARHTGLPRVRSGLGIAILTTSKGVMTEREARKQGLGGELLCEVW